MRGPVALPPAMRCQLRGQMSSMVSYSSDSLSDLLVAVRNDVRKETENKQAPWEHSAQTGRFYFNPTAQSTEAPKSTLRSLQTGLTVTKVAITGREVPLTVIG
jgi:hypothetical protein